MEIRRMCQITVEFDDATVETVDAIAEEKFRGDRDAAIRSLLGSWLAKRQ